MIKADWAKELLLPLNQLGFEMLRFEPVVPTFVFVRRRKDELFERIECDFQGRRNEAVGCYVGVSATKHISLKGLTEIHLLNEVAGEPERGWTIVETKQDRTRWLALVEQQAIIKLDKVADTLADVVKVRCSKSMNRAVECLATIDSCQSIHDVEEQLRLNASKELLRVTRRVVEWPGVIQLDDSYELYETATLLVLTTHYSGQLPNPSNPAQMPLENQSLMWELQLVADKLLQRFETITRCG